VSDDPRVAAILAAFRRKLERKGAAKATALLVAPVVGKSAEVAAEWRRTITRDDPLAFALLYMRHHLREKEPGAIVSLSEVHIAWADDAKAWRDGPAEPRSSRCAYLAPRSMGKSTWHFLILPLWAAAHGHSGFVAAFADTATQAEGHLETFRRELDANAMLREDYPELCRRARMRSGSTVADNRGALQCANGFVFTARGADSGNLGMKVGDKRPDLIVCDDLEPGESNYSAGQAAKRLTTLLDDILPLNVFARVVLVGTTTMQGSIADQLREHADLGENAPAGWVRDERFRVRVDRAIGVNADGSRRSAWPEKWPLAFLESIEHTRQYAKNYGLSPLGADGDYWRLEDFERGDLDGVTRRVLSVDPAVTTKASSDFTGLGVVSWQPPRSGSKAPGRCRVDAALAVKLGPEALRERVLRLIEEHDVGLVLVETNQGGELWPRILWGLPVPIKAIHQSVKKEVRAASVLVHYQRGRVVHAPGLAQLEGQLVAFPNAPNDDMVDAVGAGVAYFLDRKRRSSSLAIEEGAYV
jgi:predicted phage terminase large subunit-like protein